MSLGAVGLLQTTSIQQATQNVFRALLGLKKLQSTLHVQIVDAEAKFRIWAANIGAHHSQKDPRSADQKLRNATQIRTRITQILDELVETLVDLHSILSGDREAQTSDDADVGDLDQSLTSPRSEEEEILLSLDDLTSSLLEVSAFVHSTQGRNRVAYAKAATKHSSFTSGFDIAHVAHKCPKLESQPKLLKKLGEAITQRRQFLTYARDHHDKIAADAVAATVDQVEAQADEHLENLHPDIQEATTSYSRPTEALTKNTSIHSADIDEIQWARLGGVDNNDATSEVSSFMSSLPDEHEVEAAKIPELTTVCNEPGQPFECPLCYAIVAFKTQHSWRKHVFSDLRAYVCTDTECDSGLFESREAWLQHEQEVHNRDWHCPQCQHRGTDREDILSHIQVSHPKQWRDQFLLEPMIDAASVTKQGFEATNCYFCDVWGEKIQASRTDLLPTPAIVPARRFLRHLAQHMEQLALFALPLLEGREEQGEGAQGDSSGEHAIAEIDTEGAEGDDTDSDSDDADKVPTSQQLVDESPALHSATIGRPQSRSSTSSKHSHLSKSAGRAVKDELPSSSNNAAETVHDETGRKIDRDTDDQRSSVASFTDDHPPYPLPHPAPRVATPEACCAICGAPAFPECPHEGQRLELALNQAMERWTGYNRFREWVLNHARNQVIETFQQLRKLRMETHRDYLQTLPYYTLYSRYNGHPPLQPAQIQLISAQINQANTVLQQGVDQDWRTSCLRYPEVLDYYFNLAEVNFPSEKDQRIKEPRFGPDKIRSGGASKRPRRERTYTYTYTAASSHADRPDKFSTVRDTCLEQEVPEVSSKGDRVVHVYSADREKPPEQKSCELSTDNDRVIHVYPDRAPAIHRRSQSETSWSPIGSSTRHSSDEAVKKPVNAGNVKDQASTLPYVGSPGPGTNATGSDAELDATRNTPGKYDGKDIHDWAWGVHAAEEKAVTMPPSNTNDHHSEVSVGSRGAQPSVASRPTSPGSEDSHVAQKKFKNKGMEPTPEDTINPFAPLSELPKATQGQANGQSYAGYPSHPPYFNSGYQNMNHPSSYSGNPFAPVAPHDNGSMAYPFGQDPFGYPLSNPFAHVPPYPYPSGATGRYLLSKSASLARHGDKVTEDVALLLRVSGAYTQARIEANHPKISNSPVVNKKDRVVEDVALLLNVGRAYRS